MNFAVTEDANAAAAILEMNPPNLAAPFVDNNGRLTFLANLSWEAIPGGAG